MFGSHSKPCGKRRGENDVEGQTLPPLLLNIPQVARVLSLSRTKVYELIETEGLPVVRFGRAVRVSLAALQQWLDKRSVAA